jgi:hypothetical protein
MSVQHRVHGADGRRRNVGVSTLESLADLRGGFANVISTFNVRDLAAGAARFGIAVERPAAVLRRIRG